MKSILDRQFEQYPADARFAHAVLGLHALAQLALALLSIEREDSDPIPDSTVVECALGAISVARTVQGLTSTLPDAPPEETAAVLAKPRAEHWLR